MNKPEVSVIIPTHNHGGFLKKAIQSVLDQTFSNYEIIIVDNGSTDNTREVVGAFKDSRIRYHYQENSGLPGNSRNVGIKLATTGLIAFLDSDDLWYPEKLTKCIDVLQARPEIDLVCHNENVIKDHEVVHQSSYGPFTNNMYGNLLFKGNCLSTSAVVVRRQCLLDVGLFSESPKYITVEDYDLWLKLSRHYQFFFINDILGEYVLHTGNLSGSVERLYNSLLNLIDDHFQVLATAGSLNTAKALKRRFRILAGATRDLLKSGRPKKAFAFAIKIISKTTYKPSQAVSRDNADI